MSEEDYYIDILKEDEEDPKKKDEWGSEKDYPPPPEQKQPDYYQQESYPQEQPEPYQQEFYGEGYYDERQAQRPRRPVPEKGTPWFWIGVLIAVGLSAVIMVIFNFIGTSYRPGLAYLEIVLLLICCTLPGLFVRKVGKGILGGLLIFGLQFFVPLIVYYATAQDPTSFFSPYLVFLNALGLIKMGLNDVFGFSFIPITQEILDYYNQYSSYATFVWVFDLLIMFGIMITLVIASSWLFSNLFTDKAKSIWTWCLLPGQAIVIILNLVVIPWILLSLSGMVQTGGALAAGAANVAEIAMPLVSGNFTGFDDLDFQAMLDQLDRADEWFEIASGNYKGLNNLMFFRLLKAAGMQYGFVVDMFNTTIAAGFELLAALNPLAHGLLDNSNNTGVDVDGFYFQYENFMDVYEDFSGMFNGTFGGGSKPTETQIADAEVTVGAIISDIDYLLDEYIGDSLVHILAAKALLEEINPDDLRDVEGNAQIASALNQAADGLDMVMDVTREYNSLIPIAVDLLLETPHLLKALFNMLIGNVRLLLGFQFTESQIYFQNATAEFGNIMNIFTQARRDEIIADNSSSALGFFDFFNDTLHMVNPLIDLEGNLAGTLGGIVDALNEYEDSGIVDFDATNFAAVFNYMNIAIVNSDAAVENATTTTNMMALMNTRANQSEYSLMSGPASALISTINTAFQPEPYALVMANITRAINATFTSTHTIWMNDEPGTVAAWDLASDNINASIAVVDAYNNTPVYALRDFLTTFRDSILEIEAAFDPWLGSGTINFAVPLVETAILTLWTNIHVIVDEGLPP
ncbi:MAG: hypothetical protein GPJ52_11755 [Candidatus Heimdallarchaeota archaeon]|nr:hypothetical protein [Candidatus Heimdallarchaeota archaeon]